MEKVFSIIAGLLTVISLTAQESPYRAGEKVSYVIHYGVITGGIATMELKTDTFNGREVLRSNFLAQTTGVADALFRVKDIYESYMDPVTELPLKSVRNISEGRYKRYNVVLFDHNSRPDSAVLTSDLTGKHVTQKNIHDILSCFYWFRKHYLAADYQFRKGEVITIMTWFTDELYPIRMKYIGTEEVKTKVGRIRCHMFNPVTETGRLFKTEEDVSFWFSADKNFLPVKVRFDIFVGAFTVDLNAYEGLAHELAVRKK